MGEVCLGVGVSHSPVLFADPRKWLTRIHRGEPHPDEPESFKLTEANLRFAGAQVERCLAAYRDAAALIKQAAPDVILIVGDDQGENFTRQMMPPFAIYVGSSAEGSFSLGARLPLEEQDDIRRLRVPCCQEFAEELLCGALDHGIDLAFSSELTEDGLGHAHMWPLRFLLPNVDIPIVPIFVNCYFPPRPSPRRCYELGRILAQVLSNSDKRVAVIGSGGLSHFPRHLGSWGIASYAPELRWHIDEAFDRRALGELTEGRGDTFAGVESAAVDDSGNVELRNWLVMSGLLGNAKGRVLAYEPVRTVAIGLAVAVWEPGNGQGLGARIEGADSE